MSRVKKCSEMSVVGYVRRRVLSDRLASSNNMFMSFKSAARVARRCVYGVCRVKALPER